MPKIHCTLPNASHSINGIEFVDHEDGGVISKDSVSDDAAAVFAAIRGYALVADEPQKGKPGRKPKAGSDN